MSDDESDPERTQVQGLLVIDADSLAELTSLVRRMERSAERVDRCLRAVAEDLEAAAEMAGLVSELVDGDDPEDDPQLN